MAINKSKVDSSSQWYKWLHSGAVSGVRLERVGEFETLRFNRTISVRDTLAFMKKCRLRGATIKDLEALTKSSNKPTNDTDGDQTIERVPYIGFDDGKLHLSWSAPSENWNTPRFLTTV